MILTKAAGAAYVQNALGHVNVKLPGRRVYIYIYML